MPKRKLLTAPAEPALDRALQPLELGELSHDGSFAEVSLDGTALAAQNAAGVSFQAGRLTQVELADSRLEHLRLIDCVLEGCNLANVRAHHATFQRVSIMTGRLTGIDLTGAELSDVRVRDCRVDLASFSRAKLKRVSFEDCLLGQSDFLQTQLEDVRFERCELEQADFRGARMKLCELRRCGLTGLQGVESLRGAAMEWADIVGLAGLWAATLGIAVIEDDPPADP